MKDFKEEGDKYFDRNVTEMEGFSGDIFSRYTESLPLKGKKVLEVGCSTGFRLSRLDAECYGTDISIKAIEAGKKYYPTLNLQALPSDILPFENETFDVVMVSYVFHWVLRNKLFTTFSEIDRVLKSGGTLLIQDFFPEEQKICSYHHEEGLFTYKTFYSEIFKLGGYSEKYRMPFIHGEYNIERPELKGGDNQALFSALTKP